MSTNIQRFKKIRVWTKAMDFVEMVYRISNNFPVNETYGLTSQIRRAATSIPLNIAEGSAADTEMEFCRFLTMAQKSSYEVMCAIDIAKRLKYIENEPCDKLDAACNEISAMLTAFKKSVKAQAKN